MTLPDAAEMTCTLATAFPAVRPVLAVSALVGYVVLIGTLGLTIPWYFWAMHSYRQWIEGGEMPSRARAGFHKMIWGGWSVLFGLAVLAVLFVIFQDRVSAWVG